MPIEVNEIRDQIVEWGYYNRITIAPFDKNPSSLLGNIIVYKNVGVYGSDQEHCVIRFNSNLDTRTQRLVCVKELVHSLDGPELRITNRHQLDNLLNRILDNDNDERPVEPISLFEDVAQYQALAILCPEHKREELYVEFHAGKVSLEEVADTFEIPLQYAGYLVLPEWQRFYHRLANMP